jgi:hypothetical protein
VERLLRHENQHKLKKEERLKVKLSVSAFGREERYL